MCVYSMFPLHNIGLCVFLLRGMAMKNGHTKLIYVHAVKQYGVHVNLCGASIYIEKYKCLGCTVNEHMECKGMI